MPPVKETAADPVDEYVGARIRFRRKQLGISQTNLADENGITFQQIQKYERGMNRVSASKLVGIANALGCTPGYFFEGAPGVDHTDREHDDHALDAMRLLAIVPGAVNVLRAMDEMSIASRALLIGSAAAFAQLAKLGAEQRATVTLEEAPRLNA